jgi:chromosome segregation ATPase
MGFRKATAVWAAVALTATGLGTGIGVVAASQGEDRSRTTTAPHEAAANPQDRPASPPQADPEAAQAKADANKARLQAAVSELTNKIEEKEKKLRADIRPLGIYPELAATELARLSAELARLKAEVSRRQIPYELRKSLEDARVELAAAEKATVPDAVVQEAISRHPEVKRLTQAVAAKAAEIAKAARLKKRDDSDLAALKQQQTELEKQLRELKDQVRPELTEYLRCDQIVAAKRKVDEAEAALRLVEEDWKTAELEYREATDRYYALSSNMQAIRSAMDELQLLRDLRNQLRRESLIAEYGPVRTPTGSDPRVEQLQAELEEIKRELKRLSDAKKK